MVCLQHGYINVTKSLINSAFCILHSALKKPF